MTYLERPIIARNSWLVGKLRNRAAGIAGVMIHATRSGKSDGDDGPRTEGWDSNPTNRMLDQHGNVIGGSFQDLLLFEDGTRVVCCDWNRDEFPKWCAGYGALGTWAASDHYLQAEVSQGNTSDPFTLAQIDSLAEWTARQSRIFNFPITRIPYLAQIGIAPRGITTHDTCANGRIYGKSDPGFMFPWELFLSLAESYKMEETGMAFVTQEQFRGVLLRLACGSERLDEFGPDTGITAARQDVVIAEWLDDPVHKQSISDVAHSALVVALRADGKLSDDMTSDEIRAVVAEEIQRVRLVLT